MNKPEALRKLLEEIPGAVVAYSGGVDSTYLADVAHEVLGDRMVAITAVSASLSPRDREQARQVAAERGYAHEEVATNEIAREGYVRNSGDRCYFCKDELFDVLDAIAAVRSVPVLVGTNFDDLGEHRPGLLAAAEHDVRSPLVDVQMSKADVRADSALRGLPTADKPAGPCLASRVAYGVEVTPERLRRIAEAEQLLFDLGFEEMRVRDHGDMARIEVPSPQVLALATQAELISEKLKTLGYLFVSLDLSGLSSGGMNVVLADIASLKG